MKRSTKGGIIGATVAAVTAVAVGIVQPWEGRELRAYYDIVGVLTICDGDTHNVRPGQVATPAECDARLYAHLKTFKAKLDARLTHATSAKTGAAFLSWSYKRSTWRATV